MDSDMKKIKDSLVKHNINNILIDKLFTHLEANLFDFDAIKIDLDDVDPTESQLYEYIIKELKNIKIFQILKSVVHPSYKPKIEEKTFSIIEHKQNAINIIKEQSSKPETQLPTITPTIINRTHRLSIQIVDGSLVNIPDNIPYKYYETIDGITYLLNYNKQLINNQDYSNIFWIFWEDFISDESTFSNIVNDLEKKEGQIIICMNGHPPSERALPIIERIVYELQLKKLKSNNGKIKQSKIDLYKQNAINFYKQHLPEYKIDQNIINASVLCTLNEHKSNLIDIQFELFTVLIDIWDILNIEMDNINIKSVFYSEEKNEKHYAFGLNKSDANELCNAILKIKNDKLSIYKCLKYIKCEINDNLRVYQLITLGFISFIKCFICSMENGLNEYNHIQKQNKKKKKGNNIIELDFNNNNFPLQFDLVILNKTEKYKNKYFFNNNELNNCNCLFTVAIENILDDKCINDIEKYIQNIKNKMIKAFKYILFKENENNNVAQNGKNKKKQNKNKKRNDRYVIVVNRNNNKLYLYAPFINNGCNNCMIKHKKKIININEEKNENNNGLVQNKFSLIGYEANELTNFYLTSKCLVISNINKNNINMNKIDMFGVNDFEFVFSAHFHAQKDWYKHPKLKLYQYFNGGGLRFFKKHMIHIWGKYFIHNKNGLTIEDINKLNLFDDILNLKNCDEIYKKWYTDIKRFFTIK